MKYQPIATAPLLTALTVIGFLSVGCSDGGGGGGMTVEQGHASIVLLDATGTPLAIDSTVPYSPRQTCGACHDVDDIANGYHFQQGRTNPHGDIQTKDDFFDDGRDWLKSDGMYGKW